MKNLKIIIISIVLMTFGMSFTKAQSTYTLTVKITNVKNNTGQVLVALYNSESTYMKTDFKGAHGKISNNQSVVTFTNLPEGTYAVSTFHDENNNEKLDTNALGIPKEDYGFSNNPNAMFGPPSYKKASFQLTGDKTITIELN